MLAQQTRGIHPTLFQCWSTVFDAGPNIETALGECLVFAGTGYHLWGNKSWSKSGWIFFHCCQTLDDHTAIQYRRTNPLCLTGVMIPANYLKNQPLSINKHHIDLYTTRVGTETTRMVGPVLVRLGSIAKAQPKLSWWFLQVGVVSFLVHAMWIKVHVDGHWSTLIFQE